MEQVILATEEDKIRNYPEALRLYQNGVKNFQNSFKYQERECRDIIFTLCVIHALCNSRSV